MAHEEYKSLSVESLRGMFATALRNLPTKPFHHQLVSLCWAMDLFRRRIMLWHDIGTGKSLIALYLAFLWKSKRILIVCPKSVALSWKEQIRQHLPQYELTDLSDGPGGWRRNKMEQDCARIHLVNYDGLVLLFGEKTLITNKKTKAQRLGYQIDPEAISPYDLIVMDESHHLSNPDAITSKIAAHIADQASSIIMLTGSPIPTNEMALWSQYFILDRGKTLGTNFFAFRNTWFKKSGFKWVISKKKRETLLKRLIPCTLRYSVEECQDLPETIYQERIVDLSAEQQSMYDRLLQAARGEFADRAPKEDELGNIANRLYQICSGFVIGKDGEADPICKGRNPKLEELREVLQATAKLGKKILIVHNYREEGRMIEELCRKMDLKVASFRSEISQKAKQEGYEGFKQGDIPIFLFHPRSAGEGLNLQVAKYICFFSLSYLGIVGRMQSIGRIVRAGQQERCTIIDLLCRNTIETEVARNLTSRIEMVKAIMGYIQGK